MKLKLMSDIHSINNVAPEKNHYSNHLRGEIVGVYAERKR